MSIYCTQFFLQGSAEASGETSTALTTAAFSVPFGEYGNYIVFLASFLFGYSTLIAWCFYGEQCFVYIWGPKMRKIFRWAFCVLIIFGFIEAELLWSFADLLNASIVIINVTAVFFLVKFVVSRETEKSFFASESSQYIQDGLEKKLNQLLELKNQGVLSEKEFKEAKEKLLARV